MGHIQIRYHISFYQKILSILMTFKIEAIAEN